MIAGKWPIQGVCGICQQLLPDISLTKNVIVFSSESKFFSPYQHFLDPETLYATCILGGNL